MASCYVSIFTDDCLRHPIQMVGTETIWDSSCYKLLRLVEFANTDTAQKIIGLIPITNLIIGASL